MRMKGFLKFWRDARFDDVIRRIRIKCWCEMLWSEKFGCEEVDESVGVVMCDFGVVGGWDGDGIVFVNGDVYRGERVDVDGDVFVFGVYDVGD